MGKKYYCDFCNRHFNDDIQTRLKHNNSMQHQRMKKDHYRNFKGPKIILEEESTKVKCRKFFQGGNCAFGNHCTFSHYSEQELNQMRLDLANEDNDIIQHIQTVSLDDWIAKVKNLPNRKNFSTPLVNVSLLSHELSPMLDSHVISPSLKPFCITDFLDSYIPYWGD